MSDDRLKMYLNDQLAGAIAGAELAEHCLPDNPDDQLSTFLANITREIREDQAVLREVLSRLGCREQLVEKATAWLFEKASDAPPNKRLPDRSLESNLEALALGIRGRLALWMALEAAHASDDRFSDIDFGELQERARRQYYQLKDKRKKATWGASVSADEPAMQLS